MDNNTPSEKTHMELEAAETALEHIMSELNNDPSKAQSHKHYLAGVIDTLEECGEISEETRGNLYSIYCF